MSEKKALKALAKLQKAVDKFNQAIEDFNAVYNPNSVDLSVWIDDNNEVMSDLDCEINSSGAFAGE